MSFDPTTDGLPYFRTRYDLHPFTDGSSHYQIRGRFEVRMTDPDNPAESIFSQPSEFLVDTGAELSVVSEEFAVAHGFADFRQLGYRTDARGFDESAASRPTWVVPRWVRFRDWQPRFDSAGRDIGGIPALQFRLDIAVVEGAAVEIPILGLVDSHAFFRLASRGDEYFFILSVDDDGNLSHPDRIRSSG